MGEQAILQPFQPDQKFGGALLSIYEKYWHEIRKQRHENVQKGLEVGPRFQTIIQYSQHQQGAWMDLHQQLESVPQLTKTVKSLSESIARACERVDRLELVYEQLRKQKLQDQIREWEGHRDHEVKRHEDKLKSSYMKIEARLSRQLAERKEEEQRKLETQLTAEAAVTSAELFKDELASYSNAAEPQSAEEDGDGDGSEQSDEDHSEGGHSRTESSTSSASDGSGTGGEGTDEVSEIRLTQDLDQGDDGPEAEPEAKLETELEVASAEISEAGVVEKTESKQEDPLPKAEDSTDTTSDSPNSSNSTTKKEEGQDFKPDVDSDAVVVGS